ncbi:MAG: hypothetical protein KKC18_02220, partial [Chloroflexi bacterium]|nr:hypothetical protein [Chloroflexota bacterium]
MNRQNITLVVGLVIILSALACNAPITQEPGPTLPPSPGSEPTDDAEPGPGPLPPGPLIQPADLVYLGAFRLPDTPGTPDNVGWEWSNWASAMTYYPDGDPDGPDDGYPGSIFGVGHDQT